MHRRSFWVVAAVLLALVAVAVLVTIPRTTRPSAGIDPTPAVTRTPAAIRQVLFDEIQPVKLANCELERFGEPEDGGYLMCGNLLRDVRAGYSYGINGYDGWGCDISTRLGLTVHQYDCFNTTVPSCPKGATVFHAECVSDAKRVEEGRPFDTIASHFAKNGDSSKRLVMKIDVEGAEWDSFLHAPDDVLQGIDQLAVEFHLVEEAKFIEVVRKLKEHFYVAHLHFNNWSCRPNLEPFPAWAYEVLFVNKRIGVVEPGGIWEGPAPIDAPNNPKRPDCQGTR